MNLHVPPSVGLRISIALALLAGIDLFLILVLLVAIPVSIASGLDVSRSLFALQWEAIALGILLVMFVVSRLLNRGA